MSSLRNLLIFGVLLLLLVGCQPSPSQDSVIIVFDALGGQSLPEVTQRMGQPLTEPQTFKEGHRFLGWYPSITFETPWRFEDPVEEDLTLFARWEVQTYRIDFSVGEGEAMTSQTVPFGASIPAFIPFKEGHTFLGWSPALPETMPASDLAFTALWEVNLYPLTLILQQDTLGPLGSFELSEEDVIVQLEMGGLHSAVLTSLGRVFLWGWNHQGQLGDGSVMQRNEPVEITEQFNLEENEHLIKLSLGGAHSAALTSSGRVFMWGWNGHGQLGNNQTGRQTVPLDMTEFFPLRSGERVREVVLGQQFSTALTTQGRVFTWGDNRQGQLGDASFTSRMVPTDITRQFNLHSEETITSLAMGSSHAGARSSVGRVFMWGSGDNGRLGDGVLVDRPVSSPIDITTHFALNPDEALLTLVLGGAHSAALSSQGRLFMWGWNEYGQLGDGTTANRHTPTLIHNRFTFMNEETLTQVSLGAQHSAALSDQGRLWVWGDGSGGKLAGLTTQNSPMVANAMFPWRLAEQPLTLSLGLDHGATLSTQGRLFTWGTNLRGQLGDNTTTDRAQPFALRSWSTQVLSVQNQAFGTPLDVPIPLNEDRVFSGWFLDPSLTLPFTKETMPAQALTLYGTFSP